MIRQLVSHALIASMIFSSYACIKYKNEKVFKADMPLYHETIVAAVLTTGEMIEFMDESAQFNPATGIVNGVSLNGEQIKIELDEILYVRVKRVDPALTLVATTAGLAVAGAGAFLVALALKESCPFIYSWDGSQYTLDAEPLGGAIAWGLRKTDFSRLEYLRPVDGSYRLLVRNEVEEIQYLDQLQLQIIDHAPEVKIIPDRYGRMYAVNAIAAPMRAWDENNAEIVHFLQDADEYSWQSLLPREHNQGLVPRHTLNLAFPMPAQNDDVQLVVKAGTALWGSNMIREMVQLRGSSIDNWTDAINKNGPQVKAMRDFIIREELYILKINVAVGEKWEVREFISGGGPLITEERIIPLDISGTVGDTLYLQLNPPRGFWSIDQIGLTTGAPMIDIDYMVPVKHAEDFRGRTLTKSLKKQDENYVVMPEVGDWFTVDFDAPAQSAGIERSIFLRSSGYYTIQFDKSRAPRTALIQELQNTPGKIVDYAMDEYVTWQKSVSSR